MLQLPEEILPVKFLVFFGINKLLAMFLSMFEFGDLGHKFFLVLFFLGVVT